MRKLTLSGAEMYQYTRIFALCTLTNAHRLLMSKIKSPLHTPTYTLHASICIYISYVHRLLISKIGSSCTHMWACAHMYTCVCVYMDSDIEDQILMCPYVHTHVYTYVHTHVYTYVHTHVYTYVHRLLTSKMQSSNSKGSATHSYIFVYIYTEQIYDLFIYIQNKYMNERDSFKYVFIQKWTDMYEWVVLVYILIHIYISIIHAHTRCMHICMFHMCTGSWYRRLNLQSQAGARSSFMCDMTHLYIYLNYARSHTLYAPQIQRRARSIWFDIIYLCIIYFICAQSPDIEDQILRFKQERDQSDSILYIYVLYILYVNRLLISNMLYILYICTGSWYRR